MNSIRSSAVNSARLLRTEALTTPTISSSNIARGARDDVDVAVRDRVVGARADGDAGVRGHGCGSGCRRSGVRRGVGRPSASGARRSLSATTAAPGRQHRRQGRRQLGSEAPRQPVGRVEEHQIVLTRRGRCAAEEAAGVGAAHLGLDPERLEVGPHGPDRGRRAVHERRRGGAARERLDARARPSRRTGRARARPRPAGRARRTAPRARGRRSGGWLSPGGAWRRRPPQWPAITRIDRDTAAFRPPSSSPDRSTASAASWPRAARPATPSWCTAATARRSTRSPTSRRRRSALSPTSPRSPRCGGSPPQAPAVDVLVNNAGVIVPERRLSADGIELTFAVTTSRACPDAELQPPRRSTSPRSASGRPTSRPDAGERLQGLPRLRPRAARPDHVHVELADGAPTWW